MALFGETGTNRLGGIGFAAYGGEPSFALLPSLLTMAFVSGSCNNSVSVRRSGGSLSFDGWGRMARRGKVGEQLGNVRVALVTVMFCIPFDSSFFLTMASFSTDAHNVAETSS